MNKRGITIKVLATFVFAFALGTATQAQDRVFVSGLGSDVNPCTVKKPCRTFQRGYDVVNAGGEVVALDSAGYGAVSITKSVTLTGEGVYAGITAISGNGIDINSATAVVVLRNLSIYGLGTGSIGINGSDATSLHVENCIIQGFAGGLLINSHANSGIQTFVKDTVMRNTGRSDVWAGRAVFENCRFENNIYGLTLAYGATATLHNCVVAGNSLDGLVSAGPGCQMMVDSCQISYNKNGMVAASNGQFRVSNSEITNNSNYGLFVETGGTLLSRTSSGVATNTVEDNGTNGSFSGTYSAH